MASSSSSSSTTEMIVTAPLTTLFEPPPACTQTTANFDDSNVMLISWPAENGVTTYYRITSSCVPYGYYADEQLVAYSPGACPAGYTMAQFQTIPQDDNFSYRAKCCPSGAELTSGTYVTWSYCQSSAGEAAIITSGATTTQSNYVFVVKALDVQWKQEDLSNFTPSSLPLSQTPRDSPLPSSAQGPSTSQPLATPTSFTDVTSPTATSTMSHSLSTGAQAGIGVGATVGGIIIILLIVLAYILRKKGANNAVAPQADSHQSEISSNPSYGKMSQRGTSALYTDHNMEYQNFRQPESYELSSDRQPSELAYSHR